MSDIDLTQADANSLARGAPRLPTIPASFGTDPKGMIGAIKEIIEVREGQRGSRLDKSITWRDLFDQGVIALNIDGKAYYNAPSGGVVPAPANGGAIDQAPPPAPTGLEAIGALASIIISWDRPTYGNNAHAYTEVWSNGTDDIGSAQLIGTSPSQFYVDVTGSGAVRYYWIRWVSKFPVIGPFNRTAGTRGETGYDASYLIDVLKANPPAGVNYNPLLWVNADPNLVVNGVPVPLGTYMQAAYIADGTISRAKIGLAAIDDARIANLSAAKITAGDIDANRMRANIVQAVQGQFETLSAITALLGTVTISANGYLRTDGVINYSVGTGIYMGWDAGTYKFRVGTPGGQGLFWDGTNLSLTGSINATGDGNFRGSLNTGAYTGFAWPANNGQGAHVGPAGVLMGNPAGGSYFDYDVAGQSFQLGTGNSTLRLDTNGLYITGNAHFSGDITGSNGTFSGNLNAVNGTFSGTLTADAVNAVNTINIAGDAVTIGSATSGDPASITINAIGVRTVVFASGAAVVATGGDQGMTPTLTIKRNNVAMATIAMGGFTSIGSQQASASGVTFVVDYPPAGSVTYTAVVEGASSGGCYIYVEQTKR